MYQEKKSKTKAANYFQPEPMSSTHTHQMFGKGKPDILKLPVRMPQRRKLNLPKRMKTPGLANSGGRSARVQHRKHYKPLI